MRKTMAIAVSIAMLGVACGKDKKAAQIAALDDAFQSGVLTKAEYDAKRSVILAPAQLAALDDAYKSGVLTKSEYDAKRATLVGPALPPATTPAAPAPPAETTPLVTKAAAVRPDPGPAQPAAVPSTPAPVTPDPTAAAPQPAPAHANYLVMKKAVIMDQNGYERPMPSVSMIMPADWQYQGATQWNVKDACNGIQTRLVANGPDGRGFELFPYYTWAWADNPAYLQQDFATKARMGTHACDVMPPMGAQDYLRRVLPRIRPNAQVVAVEPMPKIMQLLQQQARQTEQLAAQYQLRQRVRSDVVRARLRYSQNGQPVEEWLVVVTTSTATTGVMGTNYSNVAASFAERAPQGRLEASEGLYEMVLGSIRVNPEWQARVSGTSSAIFNSEHAEIAKRSAITTQLGDDMSNIRRQGAENKQRSEDHIFGQFSQATRGVETYRNPRSGETFDFSNTYSHAWVNDRNEFVLSDQEGWDPNTALKGNWTALQHVKQ